MFKNEFKCNLNGLVPNKHEPRIVQANHFIGFANREFSAENFVICKLQQTDCSVIEYEYYWTNLKMLRRADSL
jgi:hypothetical protein